MGYENYTPEILANQLMTGRGRDCVFKNICYNGPILGEITKLGDVLHIAGVGKPTVNDYTKDTPITLESKTTYNRDLFINQAKYVNVEVDRMDEKQSQGEVFNTELAEAKKALSQTMDEYLAGFYTQAATTITETECDSTNILSTLAQAEQALLEADVPFEEDKFLVISPAVYTKLVLGKIVFQQSNEGIMGKGFKGSYLNMNVFVSNSIINDDDHDQCMAFSRQAIALAEQIPVNMIERYKPEKSFADAFKALHLYGATVIRPSELVNLKIKTVAETTV